MTSECKKSFLSCVQNYSSKIINVDNVLYYYSPIYGVASYHLLAVKVMNPAAIFSSYSNKSVTNVLLLGSFYGSSLYIFGRSHIRNASPQQRVLFSAYGGILYSFGSVLIWAVLRSILPKNKGLAILGGLVTASILTGVGREYILYTDSKVKNQ